MITYGPPKRNCFGHSIRNISPARQHQLTMDFLETASSGYTTSFASLMISSTTGVVNDTLKSMFQNIAKLFEEKIEIVNGSIYKQLSSHEFQKCFEWLKSLESIPKEEDCQILLTNSYYIENWRIDSQLIPTKSIIQVIYGSRPMIQTRLSFNSIEEYRKIKDIAENLNFFQMNDKYMKQRK